MIKELRVAVKGWARDVARNPASQWIQILDLRLCVCTRSPEAASRPCTLSSDFSASHLPSLGKTQEYSDWMHRESGWGKRQTSS